jgi:hypothetical protein
MSSTGEMALSLGFHNQYWNQVTGTLARVAVAGGGVRPVQKDVGHAHWSPDGRTMAIVRYDAGLCRLEFPPGRTLVETRDWLSHPRVAHDGKRVAYVHHPFHGDTGGDLCLIEESGARRVLLAEMNSVSGVAWSPSGDEVWCSGIDPQLQNGIWAARLDAPRRELHTSAARVTLHDVARDGRALIGLGNFRIGLNVGGDEGAREADLAWFDGSVATDFTPDCRQVLFWEGHEAENPAYACFLRDLDGSPAVRLGEGIATALSADGQWVLATLLRPIHGLVMYPTGIGEPRSIPLEKVDRVFWAGFHPDGRHLLVVGSTAGGGRGVYRTSIETGAAERLWDEEILCDLEGVPCTPDGDRLVLRRTTGPAGLYSLRERTFVPLDGLSPADRPIRFDASGRTLYVASRAPGVHAIQRLDLESGALTPWRTLSPADPTGIVYIGSTVVSTDGSRYAYSFFRHMSDLYLAENLG